VKELQGQNLFQSFSLLLKISVSLRMKFTTGARLSEGQYWRDKQNRVKFLVQRDGTLTLILSVKKRKKN
jgi:hypothetical protein